MKVELWDILCAVSLALVCYGLVLALAGCSVTEKSRYLTPAEQHCLPIKPDRKAFCIEGYNSLKGVRI